MSTYKTRFPLLGAIQLRIPKAGEIVAVEVSNDIPELVITGTEPTTATPENQTRKLTFGAFRSADVFENITEAESELRRRYEAAKLEGRPGVLVDLGSILAGCVVMEPEAREVGRFVTESPVAAEWIVIERKP